VSNRLRGAVPSVARDQISPHHLTFPLHAQKACVLTIALGYLAGMKLTRLTVVFAAVTVLVGILVAREAHWCDKKWEARLSEILPAMFLS